MLLRPLLEKRRVHSVTCCGHMPEKWLMTKDAKGSGVAGSCKRARCQCLIRVCLPLHYKQGGSFPYWYGPSRRLLYSSGPLFANIVPSLQEKREEGRKGGREETSWLKGTRDSGSIWSKRGEQLPWLDLFCIFKESGDPRFDRQSHWDAGCLLPGHRSATPSHTLRM